MFPVSDSINSSYNWVKSSKTKEEKKGLKHKMEVLALSLLQFCSVVLEVSMLSNMYTANFIHYHRNLSPIYMSIYACEVSVLLFNPIKQQTTF